MPKHSSSCLATLFLPGIGHRRLARAFQLADSWEAFLSLDRRLLLKSGWPEAAIRAWDQWLERPTSSGLMQKVMALEEWHQKNEVTCVSWFDRSYPEPLRVIPDPPAMLFCQGSLTWLNTPQIAIVGSRKATTGGLDNARAFGAALSGRGYTVTSGFALGIDRNAHEGALTGTGRTVAVLGTGLDQNYPRQNQKLREDIRANGLLITEFPVGTPPRREHFPQRNRLISGLAAGVLVVEADVKSGSLITAKQALEQGREVFAIPGSIHNPLARGCHQLIQQGAKLTTCVEDILEEIQPSMGESWCAQGAFRFEDENAPTETEQRVTAPGQMLTDHETRILDAMGYEEQSIDTLCHHTQLSIPDLLDGLCLLELKGMVQSVPGGYCRIPNGQ